MTSEEASLIDSPQYLSSDTLMQKLGVNGKQYKNA